jgi:very-short-patch-repair endonuclease
MRLELAIDATIARIAGLQYGVITFEQLLDAGLSQSGIIRRVKAGRLHRIHKGVYAVGHRGLSREGWWMAAVLACGEGAVLSHTSAAVLWGMRDRRDGPIHVTVPTIGGRARRQGLRIHRSALPHGQTTFRARIPVTRSDRTLSDLRRIAPAHEYRQALRRAEYLRLQTGTHQPDRTRSELETRMFAICRRHRLPLPEVNIPVGRFTPDFVWPEHRVVVEVDGWDGHSGPVAFEEDRARDVELRVLGWTVLRFTWRQVTQQGPAVAAALLVVLDA